MDYSNVLIAIPSKARYDRILKYTAGWLINSPFVWKVFVEPHEAALYKRVVPAKNLVVIPEKDKGLGFSMNCIGKYARSREYPYILKIDDDCKGFAVYPDLGSPAANLEVVLRDVLPDFEAEPNLGGVRFIQKRFWLYRKKDPKRYTHKNKPLWGISLYRTSAWLDFPDEIRGFTDTIHSLMMWQEGWITKTYGKAGVDVLQNAGKGGDYSFDRKAICESTIRFVIDEMFPLCKFKPNTNAGIGVDIDISAYDRGCCI